MDKRALQLYAVWAKNNLESQIEVSLKTLGINSERDIKQARKVGEYTIIDGDSNSYPGDLKEKRDSIVKLVKTDGYKQVIEEFAYTWFNRIVALRFMEVHEFLPHGFRVLSSRDGGVEPEIMKHLDLVKDELKLDLSVVQPLYAQGNLDEAYSYVLFRQCYALSGILPMLFDRDQDYLELLLPKALLKGETFITKLMEIGEEDFLNDVEVIGWLYQFYVAFNREDVRKKTQYSNADIPVASQVFTPDWIVRYMAENSVGRIWLESYPNSALKSEMKYYVEDAKQEADVQQKLNSIKYKDVNPEEIKIIEPCCGSGHILVYVFDLLYKMYEERGYQTREIPSLILKNNLVGLEIDKRAAQLASFSLVMKARTLNSRFFNSNYYVEPQVYEIWDSRELLQNGYEQQLVDLKVLTNEEIKEIKWLVEEFRYAKTIGSLLKVNKKDFSVIEGALIKIKEKAVINIFNSRFLNDGVDVLKRLLNQAKVMAAKYDVLITNPPYIKLSKIEGAPKKYFQENYEHSYADMYTMFMDTSYTKSNGYTAVVNPDSWMLENSFENFREYVLNHKTIETLISLPLGEMDSTVLTVAFVFKNIVIESYISNCMRKDHDVFGENSKYQSNLFNFISFPSKIFAYWISNEIVEIFNKDSLISDYCETREGMATADNDRFLRFWWEIESNHMSIFNSKGYYFPYTKGGDYRKWYGNNEYVVNWRDDGYDIKNNIDPKTKRVRSHNYNGDYSFREGFTWTAFTSSNLSVRYTPKGYLFDSKGSMGFANGKASIYTIMALMNSAVGVAFSKIFCGTTDYKPGQLLNFPLLKGVEKLDEIVKSNILLSKDDWDEYEFSWDFKKSPVLGHSSLHNAYLTIFNKYKEKVKQLQSNEETINRELIKLYGLEKEIDYHLTLKDITIKEISNVEITKQFISYLIGIEMGRYSLDVEGLAYAGGEWNSMNYVTYQPDDDGIIPIYTQLGMADGLTARIIKLIKRIYGEDTYRENIEFIAEALGKNQNESAEETLNRYLNYGFYADHLKTYQKRPIYWMFSSGKNDAFKCLVYLHRYNEDTLAKINSKYFLNESARLNVEVNETRTLLEAADGREKLRLDKQMKLLNARQKEMIEYGQVLDHMANQYINLDLDDGVKVNYAKFQGIEIVNDSGAKVKKDLLVPIK